MMDLNEKERLILINQYEILRKLDANDSERYEKNIEILSNGYEIFYDRLNPWSFDVMPEDESRFVLKVLDLYRFVEFHKENNPEDTEIIEHNWGTFKGFDGNNETDYMGFVQFTINTDGKYTEQLPYQNSTDNYNSHEATAGKYQSMIQKWQELGGKYKYPKETVLEILNA
jgi:uncharacterized protein YfbU (UPF0304 family)